MYIYKIDIYIYTINTHIYIYIYLWIQIPSKEVQRTWIHRAYDAQERGNAAVDAQPEGSPSIALVVWIEHVCDMSYGDLLWLFI